MGVALPARTARAPTLPAWAPRPSRNCAARAPPKFCPRLQSRSLQGRGIVVTRPSGQAGRPASLIEAAGGRAILFPAIEIQDVPDRPVPRLEDFDLAIFVSPTAVRCALERIGSLQI